MGAVMLNLVLNQEAKGTSAGFDFLINPLPLLYTCLDSVQYFERQHHVMLEVTEALAETRPHFHVLPESLRQLRE